MNVLLLRLEAPLISFGGVAIDNRGVTDSLPSASLLVGMIGNALGYRRVDSQLLQTLQDRLHYVVRIDRRGHRLQDYQTAQLAKDDKAWTTRGLPEGRAGGAATYGSPHLRYRDYFADMSAAIALTLRPANEVPDLHSCAEALATPKRPLFIGRKVCIPSVPLAYSVVEADSLESAMHTFPLADAADEKTMFYEQVSALTSNSVRVAGRRDWASDTHQGVEHWRAKPWLAQC